MRRRAFLAALGGAAAAPALVGKPVPFHLACAAITWGSDIRQAIEDIASAGYSGIQPRIEATTEFKADELRETLARRKLTFVALSSGEVPIDPALKAETLAKHTANARFVRAAGGLFLQVMDQLKPWPRSVAPEECERLGRLLTELGKRTADEGVPLVYHNHMNSISEHPANLDAVLQASDPKYVRLLFDTAHSVAGGGDPAQTLRKYRDRLALVHLKDIIDIAPDAAGGKYPFKWMELGRGRVDLPAVFAALRDIRFGGWAVVELDRTTEPSRTALQSAVISREYLETYYRTR